MARFRASIQGQRGEASRLGSTKSGILARVDGWDGGVRVEGHGGPDGEAFYIYMTAGSNAKSGSVYLGRVLVLADKAPVFEPSAHSDWVTRKEQA